MSSGNSYYNPYGSAPSRCVVDLSQLSTDSLSRYLTRFGIALPPDSSRFDFIEAVSRHYDVRLEVGDEEDVLARFVDCVRKAGLKEHPNQFEIRQYQDGQPMMGRDYDVMQHQHPQAQQQPAPQPQQFHPAAAQARPGMQHPGGSYMDQQHMYDPGMMMPHQGYPHPGFGRMPDQYGYGPMAAGEYPEEMGQYGGRRNAGMGEQQPQRKRRPKQNKNNVSAGGQTTGRESPNSRVRRYLRNATHLTVDSTHHGYALLRCNVYIRIYLSCNSTGR